MQYFRSLLFDICLVVWTVLLGTLIPILWLVNAPMVIRVISRIWARGVATALKFIVGLTFKEIGTENKRTGGVIYACNHQSAWETLILGFLIPDVAIVLKESLYGIPIVGWYLRRSPMIAINRAAGTSAMRIILKNSRAACAEGRPILIFPEGTRQGVYAHAEFHKGVALIYRELGVPVIPVAVNSGVFWGRGSLTKYSGEVTVSYLPAIMPGLAADEFMSRLELIIYEERDRLVQDLGLDLWMVAVG